MVFGVEEGIRGPVGKYLALRESAERAVGNWIDGERGYAWPKMRENLEGRYQAIPEDRRSDYKAEHEETLSLLEKCERIEESARDPRDLL